MIKEGCKIRMIENCKDNHNIKEGWTGEVDFINYDGFISVELIIL
jgi:hypothetical protein